MKKTHKHNETRLETEGEGENHSRGLCMPASSLAFLKRTLFLKTKTRTEVLNDFL